MIGMLLSMIMTVAEPELEPEILPEQPLLFYAVNVGYKDADGVSSQNFDFFELRKTTEESLALDDYSVVYINSAGTETEIPFPENATLTGEGLVFGYAKSPQYEDADEHYLYNLGSAGLASTSATLQLLYNGEIMDEIC